MKKKLLISFSGGRTSAFMTWWCLSHLADTYDMKIVFANTGREREETLVFVDQCTRYFGWDVTWFEAEINPVFGQGVRARVVDFETASRQGEPYESMILKFGIPSVAAPRCTRELKYYPIRDYIRSLGWRNYYTALGIRADEPRRLNWEKADKERLIYPLATMYRSTKKDIAAFWASQPFDLNLKSYEGNCDLCFKKSLRKLLTIVRERPETTNWWKMMEERYDHVLPASVKANKKLKPPLRFFRDYLSIDDLIEASLQPFDPAQDERMSPAHPAIVYDEEMDEQAFQCAESCEMI